MVRKNGKLILCLLAGVILVGLTACSTRKESSAMENRENGLYIWNQIDEDQIGSLFEIIDQVSIGEVYQCFNEEQLQDRSPQELITTFSEKQIETWYLCGSPEWGIDPAGEEMKRAVSSVALYNESVDPKARFTGIQFDVEPYLTDLWDQDKQKVMSLWYDVLSQTKALAKEHDLSMMICIPRWLDAVNPDILEEMIRDCCDQVAIMNYDRRDEAEGISVEMNLAKEYGRSVINVSELIKPGKRDLTDENTYYNAGLEALQHSWKQLKKAYPENDLRFAYHYLEPLKELLANEE